MLPHLPSFLHGLPDNVLGSAVWDGLKVGVGLGLGRLLNLKKRIGLRARKGLGDTCGRGLPAWA